MGSRSDIDRCTLIERLDRDLRVSCTLADLVLPGSCIPIAWKDVEGLLEIGALPRELRLVLENTHFFWQKIARIV